ncbi:hypothetical protein B0H34DRAFT_856090 [Crassisporium funariophilum]|nr:hypothetical protein B0H34DRAFT_856090 [Crassisporium funariophilum]
MRHKVPIILLFISISIMVFECMGCKESQATKTAHKKHTGKCKLFRQKAAKKRTKFTEVPTEKTPTPVPLDNETVLAITEELPREEANQQPVIAIAQEYRLSGLPQRTRRLPRRYEDAMPPPPDESEEPSQPEPTPTPLVSITSTPAEEFPTAYTTEPNSYGVYRVYPGGAPTFDPDKSSTTHTVAEHPSFLPQNPMSTNPSCPFPSENLESQPSHPFPNQSTLQLMSWMYNGTTSKSNKDLNSLVNEVLLAPGFKINDLKGFDAAKATKQLDEYPQSTSITEPHLNLAGSWLKGSVSISLPCNKSHHCSEAVAHTYNIDGLLYRKLYNVIKETYQENAAAHFHLSPFEEYFQPTPDSPPMRIYSELYTCNAYHQEYKHILMANSNSDLNIVLCPLMIWSDATHLTSFGSASLWPIYLYNGGQSKYTRSKPSSFAAHHLAYVPKLDDAFQDTYRDIYGKAATGDMLTFLRREVMQAVWELLLDDEFVDAYIDGIVMQCSDGILCRIFPRFFTYSADYPEKILLTCIKQLGNAPCPRCLVRKCDVPELGTKHDMKMRKTSMRVDNKPRQDLVEKARKLIYVKGARVGGKAVAELLGRECLTPNRNAFSKRLATHGFDLYQMFVVDLLHEFELGVWKTTFTHLLRILYAQGGDIIPQLNERYRTIPAFGTTIRRFAHNVSAMKKMAARDFEDLLQCAIPVFDGLLTGEHNNIVVDLLFELATWHGLAKLCLHTESTVCALETSTERLGDALRQFAATTCEVYLTYELPSEEAARGRRTAAKVKKMHDQTTTVEGGSSTAATARGKPTRLVKKFNLQSYKPHALGDYAMMIRLYGPTDGYSSQTDFLPTLQDHILGRILNRSYHDDDVPFTDQEHSLVHFQNHMMFEHKVLQVNYTTYDMRREQDSLNLLRQANIMLLAPENDLHPYWYARIIGIYHAIVSHPRLSEPKKMDFLRVQWYGLDPDPVVGNGWKARRLPRIGFVEDGDECDASPPFGFVDPANIVRGIHLIHAFKDGCTADLLGPSKLARAESDSNNDFNFFYVNIFSDRDMMMRFRGGGVGHASTRNATNLFLSDRHPTDLQPDLDASEREPSTDIDSEQEYGPEERNRSSTGIDNDEDNDELARKEKVAGKRRNVVYDSEDEERPLNNDGLDSGEDEGVDEDGIDNHGSEDDMSNSDDSDSELDDGKGDETDEDDEVEELGYAQF